MNRRRVARGVTASFTLDKKVKTTVVSKRVHISTLKTMELRLMLSHDPSIADMNDREVRLECSNRFGQWYMISVNEHEAL